jgi:hypothetical protein
MIEDFLKLCRGLAALMRDQVCLPRTKTGYKPFQL